MPVIPINTPTLAADIAQIAVFVANFLAGIPISFDTYINSCFALKPTQDDCDVLILTDFTDYQELGVVDLNDVTVSVSFGQMTDCGCAFTCTGIPMLPNGVMTFDKVTSDGLWGAEIIVTYVLLGITYTKTIRESFVVDCCEKLYRELSYNIWGKMSDIACTITKLSKVGRNIKTLKKSYLQLSNLLWLYYNSVDSCNERDKVFCIFNKIK